MLNKEQTAIVNAIEAAVKNKAAEDAGFRAELIADPRAVISRELGFELPPSYKLEVKEAPPNTHVLMLPALPADGELSDSELEHVAGGAKATIKQKFESGDTAMAMQDSLIVGALTFGLGSLGCLLEQHVSGKKG